MSWLANVLTEKTPLAKSDLGPGSSRENSLLSGEARDITDTKPANGPGSSSVLRCVVNICNIIIGSGIIGMPYAFKQAGLLVGMVLLLFLGFVTDYSLIALIDAARDVSDVGRVGSVGCFDYEELTRHCFGTAGYMLCLFFIFVLDYGSMLSYIVVIGDNLISVVESTSAADTVLVQRPFLVAVSTTVIMLPLCMFRNLESLSAVSAISVTAIVGIIIIIAVEGLLGGVTEVKGVPIEKEITWVGTEVFSSLGTFAFAYVCHDVSFQIYQNLENPTRKRWGRVVHLAMAVAMVTSMLMALCGYLTFYGETRGNILESFPAGDVAVLVARLVLAGSLFMTYPMNLFMCRHVVSRLLGYQGASELSTKLHVILTLVLFVSSVGIGMNIDDLGIVQSLVGGVSAIAIAYIIPAACVLQITRLKGEGLWRRASIAPSCLLVFGVSTMLLSTIQTLVRLV